MIPYLEVLQTFASLGLLWMVEPFDAHQHAAGTWLPEALDPTHVRQVGAARWYEHRTLAHLEKNIDLSTSDADLLPYSYFMLMYIH